MIDWIKDHWLWVLGGGAAFGGLLLLRGAGSQAEGDATADQQASTYFLPNMPGIPGGYGTGAGGMSSLTTLSAAIPLDNMQQYGSSDYAPYTNTSTVNTPTTGGTPVPGTDFGAQFLASLSGIVDKQNAANQQQLTQMLAATKAQTESYGQLFKQQTNAEVFKTVIDTVKPKDLKNLGISMTDQGIQIGNLTNKAVTDVLAPGSSQSQVQQAQAGTQVGAANNATTAGLSSAQYKQQRAQIKRQSALEIFQAQQDAKVQAEKDRLAKTKKAA